VIGRHLNNYEVVSLLGEGGMGTVYLALHPIMGRKAAVKVLKPELARDESLVTRFFNEARAANAIRHPNIIDIIDVGILPEDNVPYMLMEFLEGESLATRLERTRPLDTAQAVEVAAQTASALSAAHGKGIVHRDLKPDNLFLVPDEMVGAGERVKVLDFGIAKLRDDLRGSSMKTRTGAIMGTAAYMSPEQCQGLIERIDHRTDIYALGIILYEMLCGAPPFLSEGFGDIIIMHVMKEPEPPHLKNPAVPIEVSMSVVRALAKSPDDRFQSMQEMQAALRAGAAAPHTGPIQIAHSAGNTAILPQQRTPSPSHAPFAFDRTITPAPVSITPGVFQPGGTSVLPGATRPPSMYPARPPSVHSRPPSVHPPRPPSSHPPRSLSDPAKQSTTFRNAAGESGEVDVDLRPKRRTAAAVGVIVGLAAAGLGVTVLLTRPPSNKTSTTSAPEPAPLPPPPPEPVPLPELAPPTPTPAPRVVETPPPVEVKPPAEDNDRTHRRPGGARPGRGRDHGVTRPSPDRPVDRPAPPVVQPVPVPTPPLPPQPRPNTERW
jgi:serine/threonine protein kinase